MTKWEPRCPKCGCWRKDNAKGFCIHKCEACFGKTTEDYALRKKHNEGA